jgi:hypothetical protein
VTLTAWAAGGSGPLEYAFWRQAAATGEWTLVRPYSPVNTLTWTPIDETPATYAFQVWVRSVGSPNAYDAWRALGPFDVVIPLIQAFTCSTGPLYVPVGVTCTVTGIAGKDLEYEFWRYNGADGTWDLLNPYDTMAEWTYAATAPATDFVQVWARIRGSTATYQDWRGSPPIQLARRGLSLTFTSTVSQFTTVGQPTTWTVTPHDGTLPLFKFWLYSEGTGTWTMLQDYGMENVLTWTPDAAGRFAIQIWGRETGSLAPYDAWVGSAVFEVTSATLQLRSLTPNVTMPVSVRTPVSWTALASGGTGAIEYQFWLYEAGAGWSVLQDYSTAAAATWAPARPGTYAVQAWARLVGSTAPRETWIGTPAFGIIGSAIEVTAFATSASLPHRAGRSEIWTASAIGGTEAPLEYQFWIYQEGVGWTLGQAYSPEPSFVWTPPAAGTYALQAWVRTAGDPVDWGAWTGTPLMEVLPFPDVSGTWTVLAINYAISATDLTLGLTQSGSTLTGWMAGGPVSGSVSAAGVVSFVSPVGSFGLVLDASGTTMTGRCSAPPIGIPAYVIATKVR